MLLNSSFQHICSFCLFLLLFQEMREKMKTDTSLLVVGGADEQVSQSSTVSRGYRGLRQKAAGGGGLSDHIALVTLNCDQRQKISNFELILTSLSGWKKKKRVTEICSRILELTSRRVLNRKIFQESMHPEPIYLYVPKRLNCSFRDAILFLFQLRLTRAKKKQEGLTQSMVDRLIMV